jgi:hypothetical protein
LIMSRRNILALAIVVGFAMMARSALGSVDNHRNQRAMAAMATMAAKFAAVFS